MRRALIIAALLFSVLGAIGIAVAKPDGVGPDAVQAPARPDAVTVIGRGEVK